MWLNISFLLKPKCEIVSVGLIILYPISTDIALSSFLMQALSKALTEDELVYLRAQFSLLEPNGDGSVSLDNFRMVTVVLFQSISVVYRTMRL